MSLARGLSGFRNAQTGAAILLVEMPADAYPSLAASFSDDGLKAQGFALRDRETLQIGSAPAILISGRQSSGNRIISKIVLLAADGAMTALVIGQLPEGASSDAQAEIVTALRSVAFRPPLGLDDQLASLPFQIRDKAGFRPIRAMAGNSLLLTDGPADVVREASQPVLIIGESFAPAPPAAMRESFARQALVTNNFFKDASLERSQAYRQSGTEWHEIVASAKDAISGVPVIVMQTIRFEPDSYVRALGIVRADQRDAVLPRFRKAVDSITPR